MRYKYENLEFELSLKMHRIGSRCGGGGGGGGGGGTNMKYNKYKTITIIKFIIDHHQMLKKRTSLSNEIISLKLCMGW